MSAKPLMPAPASRSDLLRSWKEIANYFQRAVRTVQRWQAIGLPVRRLGSGPRPPVMANVDDLDRWLQGAQLHGFSIPQSAEHLVAQGLLRDSLQQAQRLRHEMSVLRASHSASRGRLMATLASLEKSCESDPELSTSRNISNGSDNRYSGAHR